MSLIGRLPRNSKFKTLRIRNRRTGQETSVEDNSWCEIRQLAQGKYIFEITLYGSSAQLILRAEETPDSSTIRVESFRRNPYFKDIVQICLAGQIILSNVDESSVWSVTPKVVPVPLVKEPVTPKPVTIPRLLPKINWFGVFNWSGYGQVSKNSVLALDFLGLDVKPSGRTFSPTEDWSYIHKLGSKGNRQDAVAIVNLNPNESVPRHPFNIRYTVWEATLLPPSWIPKLNTEDEIWVPSRFCKEAFRNSGVHKPITVIPHGVDLERYSPRGQGRWRDSRFTFLFIGDMLPRKGLDVFLKAFKEEFRADEPVKALIKLHSGNMNESKNIQVIREIIPFEQMPGLYHSADCYVMSSRGEGYGLCGLEALACGLSVIYTNWSGQTDFLSENIAYPISYQLVPVRDMPYDYIPLWGRAMWAEPDIEDLRRTMRHIYENRDEARRKTSRGLDVVWKNYSWAHVAQKMLERMREIGL